MTPCMRGKMSKRNGNFNHLKKLSSETRARRTLTAYIKNEDRPKRGSGDISRFCRLTEGCIMARKAVKLQERGRIFWSWFN